MSGKKSRKLVTVHYVRGRNGKAKCIYATWNSKITKSSPMHCSFTWAEAVESAMLGRTGEKEEWEFSDDPKVIVRRWEER